ncbi:hypothetical protein GCM10010172_34800 [Paractinoplanes ferrugineus]|uniref:Uncharacterized protein n=1 Tax=Paractinoplanes ferrugineus TaxID=113564 RepID=A0A919J8X8_9ACTN|nr:hypothetical protein Afe05nite_72870 [Actinoplanes ferrugineus]
MRGSFRRGEDRIRSRGATGQLRGEPILIAAKEVHFTDEAKFDMPGRAIHLSMSMKV